MEPRISAVKYIRNAHLTCSHCDTDIGYKQIPAVKFTTKDRAAIEARKGIRTINVGIKVLCKDCEKLKKCDSCNIIIRTEESVVKTKQINPHYKHKVNVSPIDENFCCDCISRRNVEKYIRQKCKGCGAKIRNNYKTFNVNGNFCKTCVAKANLRVKNAQKIKTEEKASRKEEARRRSESAETGSGILSSVEEGHQEL